MRSKQSIQSKSVTLSWTTIHQASNSAVSEWGSGHERQWKPFHCPLMGFDDPAQRKCHNGPIQCVISFVSICLLWSLNRERPNPHLCVFSKWWWMSDKRLLLSTLVCFVSFLSLFFLHPSLFLYFLLYIAALFPLPLRGTVVNISHPLQDFFIFQFCFSGTLHLHPAALWCCCLGACGQKSLHQLDLRMGRWGLRRGVGGGMNKESK